MDKVVSRQPLICLMKPWASLSDPALQDVLIKVPTMRCFAGADFLSKWIPGEATMQPGRCIHSCRGNAL